MPNVSMVSQRAEKNIDFSPVPIPTNSDISMIYRSNTENTQNSNG